MTLVVRENIVVQRKSLFQGSVVKKYRIYLEYGKTNKQNIIATVWYRR